MEKPAAVNLSIGVNFISEFTVNASAIISRKLPELPARDIAEAVIAELIDVWLSTHVYIERWVAIRSVYKRLEAFREYDGTNIRHIMRRFDITQSTAYHWINDCRKMPPDALSCSARRGAITGNETLGEIYAATEQNLVAQGVNLPVAQEVAVDIAEWVAMEFGGTAMYIGKSAKDAVSSARHSNRVKAFSAPEKTQHTP